MIDVNNILSVGKNCCGCNACEQICPKKCIRFVSDKEGFAYPQVDDKLCVDCGICLSHCPVATDVHRGKNPEVFAAKFNDRDITFKSTSGGVFMALALFVLSKNGVVFGCAYDENLVAKHIEVSDKAELYRLQSSKYVQSDTKDIYTKVKLALKADKYVLFSGTGCQVAGLKAFLGKNYDKLFTTDIICHGVVSPKLFEKYVDYMSKRLGGKLSDFNFRSKEKRGWDLYYKATTDTKSKTDYGFFDPYYNAFLTGKTYRESCYNCKYANPERAGDITLGDYWGIQKMHPDFYDENGVSLVLVNSDKGKELWKNVADKITFIPSTLEKATILNGNLTAPSERPACRDTIFDGLDGDFDVYVKTKLAFKINPKTKLKKMIPPKMKRMILKLIRK